MAGYKEKETRRRGANGQKKRSDNARDSIEHHAESRRGGAEVRV